jgi:SAM-dependent methyltransferase
MLSLVKGAIPRSIRGPLRTAWNIAHAKATKSWTSRAFVSDLWDAWDWVRGRSDPLTPPRRLVFGIGGGLENGERFVQLFQKLAGLTPDEAVLDVGCGVGRMALPLTRFLSPAGRYDGFDIVRANTDWCTQAITARWPNFRFQHADIFNREYNPRGKICGRDYQFPYPDRTFDFAFLTSVFTHLLPPEAAHYLSEVGRVLRPGGRCLATFFLLNAESERLVDAGRAAFTLAPGDGVYRVHSLLVPEMCVAMAESFVASAALAGGLVIARPIHTGGWCGRKTWLDYQDIVLFRKPFGV